MKDNELAPASWRPGLLIGVLAGVVLVWAVLNVPLDQLLRPWYLSRASGLVALVVLWLSVVLGLLQSCGLLKGLTRPGANIDLHGYTSLLGLYLTLFHGLILIFDHYTRFTVAGVLIPFASTYEPGETALGIVAFYLFVIAVVTTYIRHRLTSSTWRALHLLSLVGFVAALVHGLQIGSDTSMQSVVYLYRFLGVSVAVLTIYRGWLALR